MPKYPKTLPSTDTASKAAENETRPYEETELLRKIGPLLEEGKADKALELISRAKLRSPWVINANGVCLLRLGRAKDAVDLFRGLALSSGLILRSDAPMAFKTNLAVALAAANSIGGCESILAELRKSEDPVVEQLKAALREWRKGLSLWQKLRWFFGEEPTEGPVLNFPLGRLE
jgi:hypothetical protein